MAYNCKMNECDNIKQNGCSRVQRYSSPLKKYNNKLTGKDNQADNARAVNNVGNRVAAYYSHVEVAPSITSSPSEKASLSWPSSSPSVSLALSNEPTRFPSDKPIPAPNESSLTLAIIRSCETTER